MKNFDSAVVGATGLTGSFLMQELLKSQESFVALVRRPINDQRINYQLLDFKNLLIPPVRTLYYCFGTTLKNAGSEENFKFIEIELGRKILVAAKTAGVQQLILLSAAGVSKKSNYLYSRVKFEVEQMAQDLNFQTLIILRPSLLLGPRQESRPFEFLSQKFLGPLAKLMVGPLQKISPVQASIVAWVMASLAHSGRSGAHLISNEQILKFGQSFNVIRQNK
jgi:uncharacterized protein YbjT (DUF2867 family)